MFCVAETQAVPPVQVFDKTMVVKQMHVLEPQDLLITRADKGTNSSSSSRSFFPPSEACFCRTHTSYSFPSYLPSLTSLMLLSTYLTFPAPLSQ